MDKIIKRVVTLRFNSHDALSVCHDMIRKFYEIAETRETKYNYLQLWIEPDYEELQELMAYLTKLYCIGYVGYMTVYDKINPNEKGGTSV